MPRFVRLGAASELVPQLVSAHAMPDQDYPVTRGVVVGHVDDLGRIPGRIPGDPNSYSRRMFRRRDIDSVAARRRDTGEPKWFMTSYGPSAGALFVDTDGFRVQDGDDF